jgi:hypothetical protein
MMILGNKPSSMVFIMTPVVHPDFHSLPDNGAAICTFIPSTVNITDKTSRLMTAEIRKWPMILPATPIQARQHGLLNMRHQLHPRQLTQLHSNRRMHRFKALADLGLGMDTEPVETLIQEPDHKPKHNLRVEARQGMEIQVEASPQTHDLVTKIQ